ncbi:MAG: V-type ATP synthase subunit D [Candidatus Odinarchaeota archaeon]
MSTNIIAGTKATRMELLTLKKKKQLAQKGYELLKEKRDALIMEFFRLIEDVKELRDRVESDIGLAFLNLKYAKMVDGPLKLYGLASSIKPTVNLEVETHNVMGVKMPRLNIVSREEAEVQHSLLGFSSKTDDARRYFSKALDTIIKLAEIEGSVKRLAEEIEKSKRRVNALRSIVIPRIEATINYIELHLEEAEREDFTRLKFIKRKLSGG